MATATSSVVRPTLLHERARIPWYLWCAVLAVTSVTIGAQWDVSWHRSIGRDTFWTPAHMTIYLCGVLAGICCGYLILRSTFAPTPEMAASSVRVFGFRGPLGAFLAAWGGIAMITSAPFDNWWHNAYGLDVKIVSPPHTLLMLGIFAVDLGTMLLILAEMNRAGKGSAPLPLQRMMLCLFGLMMVLTMFFRMEYTSDVRLHNAGPYISIAIGVPLYLAAMWKASRFRWACTMVCGIYMAIWIAFILILPLFPASPKLGPVYIPVTHFVPPRFPLLLIVPALALDLLWARVGEKNKILVALASGPLFVLTLVAAEWPFADFLMSKASRNRLFGTMYNDYGTPPWSHSVTRTFLLPQHGAELWTGLTWAMLYAAISVWLGLMVGNWMRKVQR